MDQRGPYVARVDAVREPLFRPSGTGGNLCVEVDGIPGLSSQAFQQFLSDDDAFLAATVVSGFYVTLSVLSLLTAMCVKWSPLLFFTYLWFGAVSMLVFISVAFANGWNPAEGADPIETVAWVAFLLPFAVLLTSSLESFCRVAMNFIPYVLCLPLTINYYAVYAFARTSDLSWGNRPSTGEGEDAQAKEEQQKKAQFNRIGFGIAMLVLLSNGGIFFAMYYTRDIENGVVKNVVLLFAGSTALIPLLGTFVFNLWRLFVHVKRCCCGAQTLSRKIMRNRHERLQMTVQKNAMDQRKYYKEILESLQAVHERLDILTLQQQNNAQQPPAAPERGVTFSKRTILKSNGSASQEPPQTPSTTRRAAGRAGPQGLAQERQGWGCITT
uniref:Uncharacterized protein n=1 Tax=Chromera velia CCMP2878 TaxID=1169474 RepID=A0A0K6SBF8_9ALVE|eukprot:Cvel_13298.t1-p1 / transcript=Cvel_13298.t1 / gene=Cvel_13298 / organism=Chromera_velia_CCMP2878 / gene_product=hypothetical protein / transcript_product=hypothetical protein / location=Cvel_scaffold902:37110-40445(-) / protein_length=383 / sequence_SO=supercontig / SO=protein_coding / is_pseudo=false